MCMGRCYEEQQGGEKLHLDRGRMFIWEHSVFGWVSEAR